MIKKPTEKHLATFRLSKDCRDKLKQLAEDQNISQAAIIQNLIKNENITTTTKQKIQQ
jgi:predicted transcriptional regulator